MRLRGAALLFFLASLLPGLPGQSLVEQVRRLESGGDALAARNLLERTIRDRPGAVESLAVYAEFLDRHGDPRARRIYRTLLETPGAGGKVRREAARRLTLLDLTAGDRESAARHLGIYREAGGEELAGLPEPASNAPPADSAFIEIPGPITSFARMAAIPSSPSSGEVLPALARHVMTNGYRPAAGREGLQPTEYMNLIHRYLSQARELEQLTDESGAIVVEECESAITSDLLRVLGYGMRGGCGGDVVLETMNATRAFLTIDSGFPLAQLETALRSGRPFRYDYRPARVPVLYGAGYWLSKEEMRDSPGFIDAFLQDPATCRLYLALSKMDRETAAAMRKRSSMERLKAFAHVLDYFGSLFEIRDGRAVVPGSRQAWGKLVGASPDKGAEFYEKLIARDDGWLASYYDALLHVDGPAREYLASAGRLERFYRALRGRVTSPGPARPVFRSNADLMLFTTRLWLEPGGAPHIPGGVNVWKQLYIDGPKREYDKELKRDARDWDDAGDVLEAAFVLCRKPVDNAPLKIFMALSDMGRHRRTPLQPDTVYRLARSWRDFGDQYPLLAETELSDATINAFLDAAESVRDMDDRLLRADTAGIMQSLAGLWQIFTRNGIIPESKAGPVLAGLLEPYATAPNRRELFARARAGIELLAEAADGESAAPSHDRFMDLLAGASRPDDLKTYGQVVTGMKRIFADQKLLALDLILETDEHLQELEQGGRLDDALVKRLSDALQDVAPRRRGMTSEERTALSIGYWAERHLNRQRRLDVRKEFRQASASPKEAADLRNDLTFLLRDTLVGYNYLHYAPPGAQLLRANPRFVRGHDFIGFGGANATWREAEVYGSGWPSSAGGRLVGSLAGLPYALAQAEQNFLVPEAEQALIWVDLAPQMIMNSKIPRWWNQSAGLLHWTALHMRLGRSGIAEASLNPVRLAGVAGVLRRHAAPARRTELMRLLQSAGVPEALGLVTPAELFVIGKWLAAEEPGACVLSREIKRLAEADPGTINYAAVSRSFGSAKPRLTHTYRRELLNLRTFPTLMGYSSRLMAESWESSLLYFALLADELYLRPSQLNLKVPEWTQSTLETIFAAHLGDWPAVLRSLHSVGARERASAAGRTGAVERAAVAPQ